MRDLVPFIQFKKHEKHLWRSVNFSKVACFKPETLLKLTLLHGCFLRFLNCANGTISRNASQCHWNLNSISADNYTKLFLLKAHITVQKFDIICLSEIYRDSSSTSADDNLEVLGYNVIRSHHPSNNKHGGVCIYYKNFLPLGVLSIQYLQECINFELNIGGKISNLISIYRSPSQTQDKFEKFIENLVLNLESLCQNNSFLIALIEDLNGKSRIEENAIENVTAQFGLQ